MTIAPILARVRPRLVQIDRSHPINKGCVGLWLGGFRYPVDVSRFKRNMITVGGTILVDVSSRGPATTNSNASSYVESVALEYQRPQNISVMVRAAILSASDSMLFSHTNGGSWSQGSGIYAGSLTGGKFSTFFFVNNYTGASSVNTGVAVSPLGVLSTIVGTYDGATLAIWADGVRLATVAYSTAIAWPATAGWALGGNSGGFGATAKFEQARVWNRALAPGEIIALSTRRPHLGLWLGDTRRGAIVSANNNQRLPLLGVGD